MQKTLTKLSLIWRAAPKTFLALICTFAFQQTASAAVLESQFIYSVAAYSGLYKSYLDKYCVNGDGLFYNFDGAIYATEGKDFLYHFGCYKYKPNLKKEQISKELNEVAKTKFSDKGTVKIIDLIPKDSCFNKNYPEGWISAQYTGDACRAYGCDARKGYYLSKDPKSYLTCKKMTPKTDEDCTCAYNINGYATKCTFINLFHHSCWGKECKPGYDALDTSSGRCGYKSYRIKNNETPKPAQKSPKEKLCGENTWDKNTQTCICKNTSQIFDDEKGCINTTERQKSPNEELCGQNTWDEQNQTCICRDSNQIFNNKEGCVPTSNAYIEAHKALETLFNQAHEAIANLPAPAE